VTELELLQLIHDALEWIGGLIVGCGFIAALKGTRL